MCTPEIAEGKNRTSVKIRNILIGEGIPKICVPILGATKEEIIAQARAFDDIPADLAEWRVDWFEHVSDFDKVVDVLEDLRRILGDTPLLMTFRSLREGGERELGEEIYAELNIRAARSGFVDLVDVELFTGDEIVKRIIREAHEADVKVIVSNHDFLKTPDKDELVGRLRRMQELGADLPKIAVMPRSKKDVLVLLAATEEMASHYADRPIITMSMEGTGVISRVCGELFGSAITFGAAGLASAPGQMSVGDLKTVLTMLHHAY